MDDSFGLHVSIVGHAQRSFIRQPNIQIKPILNIFGKELGFKPRAEQPAYDQEHRGPTEDGPTVFYSLADEFVIEAVKPSPPSLLDGWLGLCWGAQNVVTQERDKRHRHKKCAQQGSRHYDGKALQELAGIAAQHQKWQVGDDVRDRRVENRGCKLCRSEPARCRARKPFCQMTFYAVASDYRHVDEKAKCDDQRCDGDLLKINSQYIYDAKCHRQCDRYGESHDQRQAPLPKSEQRWEE